MSKLSCAIIGEGNITLSCLDHLLECQFHIEVVISNTHDVTKHCSDALIETFPRRKNNVESILKERSFDYLFSINNPTILSEDVLKTAKHLTINYHDSLLPAYAGVHATSWAIIEGEKTHGVSWHIVEPGIDTGDILQSQAVDIDENDSALSLNLKCFEACSEAFKRLVNDIVGNNLKPAPQNLENRSYFGLYKTPSNLGVLMFQQDATCIYNMSRAMDFGAHVNQLGSPKICAPNGSFLLVTNCVKPEEDCNDGKSLVQNGNGQQKDPGTILNIVESTITVATSTDPISLTLAQLDGHQLKRNALTQKGFKKGGYLPSIPCLGAEIFMHLRKKEAFWRRTMKSYDATTLFVQKLNVLPDIIEGMEGQAIQSTKLQIPNKCFLDMEMDQGYFMLSSFIAFLGRSCCSSQIHIGLVKSRDNIPKSFQQLYSRICPGIFNIDFSQSIKEVIQGIGNSLCSYHEAGTFLIDMFYRFPELRDIKRSPHHNIVIALDNDQVLNTTELKEILRDCHLLVTIGTDSMTVSYVNKTGNSYTRVEAVLRHFPAFLTSMTSHSNSLSLLNVDLISPTEKDILYVKPNFKTWEESDDILNYMTEVANEYQTKMAITTTEGAISYCALFEEVSNLSYILQQNLPDDYRTELKCIALHMPNSIAYVIGLIATMSTNCPFLPLPQNLPIPRLAFMLQDARATLMLTTREIHKSDKMREFQAAPEVIFDLETTHGNIVLLRLKHEMLYSQQCQASSQLPEVYSFTSLSELASNDDPEETPLHPDCCYVMYTSGSTGRPKGVQVLRSGVLNMALAQINKWDLGPNDIIAQFASIGFDASISEIFTSLLSGANLVILKESERLGKEFTTTMTKLQVTTITLPPSVLNIYKPKDFPMLRKVVTAGEACTASTAVRWTSNTGIRFFNAYGPTESTVCATIHEFDPTQSEDTLSKELSIGKAIQGVQVYLFDDFMKPVPPNIGGEIFVGGQSLSAGYTGHASSKNQDRFLENPLFPGFIVYKTGDHALQAEDGSLTYIGRMDDQIKIRGQRVDLNEIEQVLLQHSKVEMAVVVKHQSSSTSDPTIAAFIAPTFVFISELREYLSKALPSYMIPGYIRKMEIEDFPTNLSGKIDRKKLERSQEFITKTLDTASSHLNETQLKTAKLWCQVLQLDETNAYSMHRQSSFVEHGGNSLHMVLLQRAIEKEFGVLLSFTDIGGASTVENFAEMIDRKSNVFGDTLRPQKMIKEDLKNIIIQDSVLNPKEIGISDDQFYSNSEHHSADTPTNILLSGTTGFLGAYLLHEILEQTKAHVCCMVRESNEVRGFGRVVSNMRKYDLWKSCYDARIAIVLSDISKPALGIAPDIYTSLSNEIDTVFMNAAKMNFNTDYFDHKTANVDGTKQFINFCFTGRKKFLFTTSSLGVFLFPNSTLRNEQFLTEQSTGLDTNGNHDMMTNGQNQYVNGWLKAINDTNKETEKDDVQLRCISKISADIKSQSAHSNLKKTKSTYIELVSNPASFKCDYESIKGNGHVSSSNSSEKKTRNCSKEDKRVIYHENDQVSDPTTLSGGYNQSKWVSERLVQQALKHLPGGAIFRPARISGHSKSGVGPSDDLFACILKGVESLGYAPELCFPYDLTPVDYCAKGMIEIMSQLYPKKEMPHVYHFFNQATIPFLRLFKDMDVRNVSLEDWRVRMKSADRDNVLVPFMPFIESDFWDRSPDWPVFDTTNTDCYLSAECKECLPTSDDLLKVYRQRSFTEK